MFSSFFTKKEEEKSLKISNPTNQEECKKVLDSLDYLRKSQCTIQVDGRNLLGHTFLSPHNDEECSKTLRQMEKIAKECLELSVGLKR